jgi:hypothetical protein
MYQPSAYGRLLPAFAAMPGRGPASAQRLNQALAATAGRPGYEFDQQSLVDYWSRRADAPDDFPASFVDDILPQLRQPIVTWDQMPLLYAGREGQVVVWARDDEIIRYLGRYRDEREYADMRRAVAPVKNSINAITTQLLGYGYALQTPRLRKRMPAAQRLRASIEGMLRRIDGLHAFLEIAVNTVMDGWLPVQTWWSPYLDTATGKRLWGPDKIFEMQPWLFGVTPDRDLAWLGYTLSGTAPEVLNGEEDSLSWAWFQAGSTRSPYGEARQKHLWLIAHIWKQALEWHAQGARNALQGVPVLTEQVASMANLMGSGERLSGMAEGGQAAMNKAMAEAQQMMGMLREYGVIIVRQGYEFKIVTTPGYSDGWGRFVDLLQMELTVGIQGQHLTQSLGEHGGSRATADVQAQTKVDQVRHLARSIEPIINTFVARWLACNFGESVDSDDVSHWSFKILDPLDPAKLRTFLDYGGEADAEEVAERWGDIPVDQAWLAAGGTLKLAPPPPKPPGPNDAGTADRQLKGAAASGDPADGREPAEVPDEPGQTRQAAA